MNIRAMPVVAVRPDVRRKAPKNGGCPLPAARKGESVVLAQALS